MRDMEESRAPQVLFKTSSYKEIILKGRKVGLNPISTYHNFEDEMSETKVIQDVFGTPVQKGQVVLLSKGTRGFRNFEQGVVIEILDSGKQLKIKTLDSFVSYKGSNIVTQEHYHYVDAGLNRNLLIVDNLEIKSVIPTSLINCVPSLIANYKFPTDYKLGQVVTELRESEPISDVTISSDSGIELSENDEPKMFSILGAPKSLLKESNVKSN